jgi:hypothetical protein
MLYLRAYARRLSQTPLQTKTRKPGTAEKPGRGPIRPTGIYPDPTVRVHSQESRLSSPSCCGVEGSPGPLEWGVRSERRQLSSRNAIAGANSIHLLDRWNGGSLWRAIQPGCGYRSLLSQGLWTGDGRQVCKTKGVGLGEK